MEVQLAFCSIFISFRANEIQPDTGLIVSSSTDLQAWNSRATRGADGFWTIQKSTVAPGGAKGDLRQQAFSAIRVPGGKEFFRLEARELAP